MPKINELTAATALTATDVLAMDNTSGTATRKVTGQQIKDFVNADVNSKITDLKNALNYNKQATPGYILRATNRDNGSEWAPVGTPTDAQTHAAVDAWMNEHSGSYVIPDGNVTTDKLHDGAVTFYKLDNSLQAFVTPQMFGAVGDGITDDTSAFQSAVSTGLPIRLKSDYKCGKVTGTNVFVIGDGHKIINKTNDSLFSMTGSFYAENLVIENQQTFDYHTTDAVYGTISALNIYCQDVKVTNVNSAAFYATGDCVLDFCVVDNTNFNVKTIYDGSADNHSFGVYIHQTSASKVESITNCRFYSLIEGLYIGTYADGYVAMTVGNNYFETIGDHCVYCNSYGDRVHADVHDNVCYRTATSFAMVGNNHVIRDNFVFGAFDGSRVTFGFSLRNGSNIKFINNVFISGSFTTSAGIGANCLIYSEISGNTKSNIVLENNFFDFQDSGTTVPWLRIGATGYNMGDIILRNNYMSIKGGNTGISSIVACDLYLLGNKIYFDQNPFLTLGSVKAIVRDNYVENLENTNIFQISVYGEYNNNKFNTKGLPLRRPSDLDFDVENNVNLYGIGVYNLMSNVATTKIKHRCNKKGTFVATAQGAANIYDNDDIRPAFNNKLLITDSLGNIQSFTVTNVAIGRIDVSIPGGTYYYNLF